MKQTKERGNMTLALVRYARLGVWRGCKDLLEVYKRIDGVCGKNRNLALDLFAVRELLLVLWLQDDELTLKALKEIYFLPALEFPKRRPRRNEISSRILRFACENYMDERTVYRKLRKARELWVKIRYPDK